MKTIFVGLFAALMTFTNVAQAAMEDCEVRKQQMLAQAHAFDQEAIRVKDYLFNNWNSLSETRKAQLDERFWNLITRGMQTRTSALSQCAVVTN